MIIRQLQPQDCFAAKALWQTIFHDTEPFANFFFSHRYTPTLSFGAFDDGALVSMALGRRVRLSNPDSSAVLISGVSTLPTHRHQGLMTETVNRLLDNAQRRGYDAALLSPAIPDLYVPFGFRPISFALRVTETAAPHPEIVEIAPDALEDVYPIYAEISARHLCMVRRTLSEMRTTLDEYARDDGRILLAPDHAGYLCYLPGTAGIEVTECLAEAPAVYRALLEAAASRSASRLATADLPTDCAMSGTLIRPVHGRALQSPPIHLPESDRRAFCVEKY